ncbi:hypothetical protein ACSSS7_000553 [Eimeria intestinalis]
MEGAPGGAPRISEEEWLLQAIAAATEDGGLRASPTVKASTPPPSAAAAAGVYLARTAQGGNNGRCAGFKSFTPGALLESGGLATFRGGPLGAPGGLVHVSGEGTPRFFEANGKVDSSGVGPSSPVVGGSLKPGGPSAQSIMAPAGNPKSVSSGLTSASLEALLGASLAGSLVGSFLGLPLEGLLRRAPLGTAIASPNAALPCAATPLTSAQPLSQWAPQQKTPLKAALPSSAAAAPLAPAVAQEAGVDLQERKTARAHQLSVQGPSKASSAGDVVSSSEQVREDMKAPKATEDPSPDLVVPLPRSFLDNLNLDDLLSAEEIAAYEASLRSNCLLWLPLERRQALVVPGLVVYTHLQNLSVCSKFIFCLSPSARQAVELQRSLEQALALISPPGGPSVEPLTDGSQGLIVRIPTSREGRDTAAARLVERYWRQKKLRVKWGDPSIWERYRGALKEYGEAVRELEGVRRCSASPMGQQVMSCHLFYSLCSKERDTSQGGGRLRQQLATIFVCFPAAIPFSCCMLLRAAPRPFVLFPVLVPLLQLGHVVPTTGTEKQRYNLQRLLAPFRFATSQLEALKAISRTSERPPTPPARAPYQDPREGQALNPEEGCPAPNELEETIPEEALLRWPRVFVATPSVFTTLLMHGFVRLEEVALLLLDCSSSSSSKTQPYEGLLTDFVSRATLRPRILGLIRGPIGGPPRLPSDVKSILRRLHCSAFLLAEPLGLAGAPPDIRICRYTSEPGLDTAKEASFSKHDADAVRGRSNTADWESPSRHCLLKAVSFCFSVCDRWVLEAAAQRDPEMAPLHSPSSVLVTEGAKTTASRPFTAGSGKATWREGSTPEARKEGAGGLNLTGLPLDPSADCLLAAALSGVERHPFVRANSLCMHAIFALLSPNQRKRAAARWRRVKDKLLYVQQEWGLWCVFVAAERLRRKLNRFSVSICGSPLYAEEAPKGRNPTAWSPLAWASLTKAPEARTSSQGGLILAGGASESSSTHAAALPTWLSWPFGEALRLQGSDAYLSVETESPLGSCGALMMPPAFLLQRRLQVGLGFVFLELLAAFVRKCVPEDSYATFQHGLQGLTTSLSDLAPQRQQHNQQQKPQQQQQQQQQRQDAGVSRAALQSLFSPRLVELDRILCRLHAQDQSVSWGEDPQSLPPFESLQREGRGDIVCLRRAVDRLSPLRLTVSASVREVLSDGNTAGYGLVIMTETPDTEEDLLRAVAACRKPTRALGGLSVLLLLAPDDGPQDSHSTPSTQCRWAPSRRSTRRFELYDLLRRVHQLKRCATGEALLSEGGRDPRANEPPAAFSPQQQKTGVTVPTTGAFVPSSSAWGFLQQVLSAAYGEAACEAYRAARGPSASACFTLGPLKARREYAGAPRLEIPPLKGFREEPLFPQVLEALDSPAASRGPQAAGEMRGSCGSWREPWERLAVQALQRLHAAGVLNDYLLVKPVAPFEEETEEAIRGKGGLKREGNASFLETSWRLLPQGLLAPKALNRLLLEGESAECCIELYVHRVWCTPVTWQQMQQEQQWQEQQHEPAAPRRSSGEIHSSSKAEVPLPCSPLYESGGLLGYWSLFSSNRKARQTETAAAAEEEGEATKAAAAELLTKLFPHKPISSVLQPLALLLPSALPEPVVMYGVHPMGLWRGPLFPTTNEACERPSQPSDSEDEDGGPRENSSSEPDSEGETPEALPGEEGLMRIEIEPPTDEGMILRIPSAAVLKALLVFTHDMLLRDVAVSSFRPFVGKRSEVGPLWRALFAAASRGPPSSSSCGTQVGGPQQHSSANLRLYAANDESALAYLDSVFLHGDGAAAAPTAATAATAPQNSTKCGSSSTTGETPQSTSTGGSRKDSLLQVLLKAGVNDIRRILLPFFAVAPLAWDGKGLDLAYLCTQRLLACFAASSKCNSGCWLHVQSAGPFVGYSPRAVSLCLWLALRHAEDASRSLMEAHGEEALRDSVRSLAAPISASDLIASALRRLDETEGPSSSTLAAPGNVPPPPNAQAAEETAAELRAAEAPSEGVAEGLLFSAGSPLARVGASFPFKEFCRAGGLGGARGPLAPLTGAESLHPQKGLYVFRALAARGLERPVLRLTHDERRSYRYAALKAVDTQNTPWGSGSPTGGERPLLSDVYRKELSQAGVHLLEPHPDPLRGPHGNCWLLRGPRIRQGCRALFRDDKGVGAPSADTDAAYAPQFARLCPWTEPVFHGLSKGRSCCQWLPGVCLWASSADVGLCDSSFISLRLHVMRVLCACVSTAAELDSRLLFAALTTPVARQLGDVDSGGPWWHSQRLEFLGDAVLTFIVSLCLFLCHREGDTEGVLTDKRSQFVSNAHLAACAKQAGFCNHILARPFSPSAALIDLRRQSLSSKMQADAVEALIASIYLSNASFLATHNHTSSSGSNSSSNSSNSSTTEQPQEKHGGAACAPAHLRGPLVTQEASRSFGGLIAAASFIDRFILRSCKAKGAFDNDVVPASGASQMLPPAVSILTAAAAACRRCCRTLANKTTNAVKGGLPVLDGPSEEPLHSTLSLEETDVPCILWPLYVAGQETPEPRLDSYAQTRPLLQQLMGILEGSAHTEAVSLKDERRTQTHFAAFPPAPHVNSGGFPRDRRLPQQKASHAAVSDMWLACARQSIRGYLPAVAQPQSHEVQLVKKGQMKAQKGNRSFWKQRHLNLRLVAQARTVQVKATPKQRALWRP